MIANIFSPIIESTQNPEANPEIASFLQKVVAFDLVNDEEKNEKIKSFANYKVIPPQE